MRAFTTGKGSGKGFTIRPAPRVISQKGETFPSSHSANNIGFIWYKLPLSDVAFLCKR